MDIAAKPVVVESPSKRARVDPPGSFPLLVRRANAKPGTVLRPFWAPKPLKTLIDSESLIDSKRLDDVCTHLAHAQLNEHDMWLLSVVGGVIPAVYQDRFLDYGRRVRHRAEFLRELMRLKKYPIDPLSNPPIVTVSVLSLPEMTAKHRDYLTQYGCGEPVSRHDYYVLEYAYLIDAMPLIRVKPPASIKANPRKLKHLENDNSVAVDIRRILDHLYSDKGLCRSDAAWRYYDSLDDQNKTSPGTSRDSPGGRANAHR